MQNVLKYLVSKSVVVVVLLAMAMGNNVKAQVLVAGTQFTPLSPTAGKTFYSITDVGQYGMLTGALSVTPPITPNTNAGIFNGTAHYAITTNPDTLDNTRYENLSTATNYMMVLSPPNFNSSGILASYTVSGLVPGSNVSATVTFCNVTSTTRVPSCVGQSAPLKGVLNPDQYNTMNGSNTATQVSGGQCATYTWTQASGSSNTVNASGQAVFNINQAQGGACEAVGISKIEIYGTPNPIITSSAGSSVCASEQTILQLGSSYDSATYQWTKNGTNIAGATSKAYLATAGASGTTDTYLVKVTYHGTTFNSNSLSLSSITCCTAGGSRQTVYYNDFGTFDLTNDPTGKTYYLWDYSNPLSPVQVKYTTTNPFRYSLANAPAGATFATTASGPINTSQYAVAAGFNGYQSYTYNGTTISNTTTNLQWAANIGGASSQPAVTFDHSGQFNGAALLLNVPAHTQNQVIYSDTIPGLCGNKTLYFSAYINVFTSSAPGTYNPVNMLVKLIDKNNPTNFTTGTATTTAVPFGGCGCWVQISGTITLSAGSSSLIFQLLNNQDDDGNGDDLVLDDISILACSPPTVNTVFDQSTLATTTTVCTSDMDLFALSGSATTFWSGAGQTPLDYIYQYTYTPTVNSSWKTLGSVTSAISYVMTSPKTNAAFTGTATGNPVYFRVVVGPHGTLSTTGTYSSTDACGSYAASGPITASVSCPLPVKLISFEGSSAGSRNILTWATSSEEDNDYFQIEKSSDGKNFTPIGQVSGEGTTSTQHTYKYTDNNPANGVNYYRLKQVDFNGAAHYSNTIVLDNASSDAANIAVYPNPNNGSFSVELMNPGPYTLEVTDLQGQRVYYTSGTSAPEIVKVNGLTQGLYIVQVTIDNQVITKKVVVY